MIVESIICNGSWIMSFVFTRLFIAACTIYLWRSCMCSVVVIFNCNSKISVKTNETIFSFFLYCSMWCMVGLTTYCADRYLSFSFNQKNLLLSAIVEKKIQFGCCRFVAYSSLWMRLSFLPFPFCFFVCWMENHLYVKMMTIERHWLPFVPNGIFDFN